MISTGDVRSVIESLKSAANAETKARLAQVAAAYASDDDPPSARRKTASDITLESGTRTGAFFTP